MGKIRGFLHLHIGEEAVAVGAIKALLPDEAIVATYREHGHALVRGTSAGSLMAELYGKANGCARGRGGSMHFFDASRRFYGGLAIVGGGLPVAVGLALADKLHGLSRVTPASSATAPSRKVSFMNRSIWRRFGSFPCCFSARTICTRWARRWPGTDRR